MADSRSSYRQIVKSTSLFGGVQVMNILVGIVRSKIVAVLLGPGGMGIFGLLNSSVSLISGLTNFGLGTSAVRNISEANKTGNSIRISIVSTVIRRLVVVTGLLGMLITLAFSPLLSKIAFGNSHYTLAFVFVSVTLLLTQISTGQTVLLRGMRQLGSMARSNIYGSLLGLVTTIPLYYILREEGIVPAIIIAAVFNVLLTNYYSRQIKIQPVQVSFARTLAEGKGMMKMGFMISITALISIGTSFLNRIYISNIAGVEMVGLYTAGFAIINTYVGMIFTAMGTDFYPRLSAVNKDNNDCRELVNQQAEIAILIISPIICGFLIFLNWILIILYSTKFLPVKDMIMWAALSMFFKAASWPVGFIFLAKGDTKIYFWSELAANITLLIMNIVGFRYLEFTGMGLSFLISYIIVFFQVLIIAVKKYTFSFDREFYRIFLIQLVLGVLCFSSIVLLHSSGKYIISIAMLVFSMIFSYYELDRRIGIKSLVKKLIGK